MDISVIQASSFPHWECLVARPIGDQWHVITYPVVAWRLLQNGAVRPVTFVEINDDTYFGLRTEDDEDIYSDEGLLYGDIEDWLDYVDCCHTLKEHESDMTTDGIIRH